MGNEEDLCLGFIQVVIANEFYDVEDCCAESVQRSNSSNKNFWDIISQKQVDLKHLEYIYK